MIADMNRQPDDPRLASAARLLVEGRAGDALALLFSDLLAVQDYLSYIYSVIRNTVNSVTVAADEIYAANDKAKSGGETIFIGSYGRPEAVLTSAANANRSVLPGPKKRLGLLEGKLLVPDDFDAPLPPEILAAFEGDPE